MEPNIRINFTVIQEHPNEGTTFAGDEFPTFELANKYALSWAREDWANEKIVLSKMGIYENQFEKISVVDISITYNY